MWRGALAPAGQWCGRRALVASSPTTGICDQSALKPAANRTPAARAGDAWAPGCVGRAQGQVNLHFHVAARLRFHPQVTAAVADERLERSEVDAGAF